MRRHAADGESEADSLLAGEPEAEPSPKESSQDKVVRRLNYVLLAIWVLFTLIFAVWLSTLVVGRWNQLNQPGSTSVQVRGTSKLNFPAITICNLATKVPLTHLWCGSYDNGTSCSATYHSSMEHCLVYNNEHDGSPYSAAKTGLADTLMIVLRINVALYPPHSRFSGVHVNLHNQCVRNRGECPEELSSSLMAAPGTPRFYRMSRVVNEYLNGTKRVHFDARDSDAGDFDFEEKFGWRNDTIVLGFHYSTMSEMVIREMPPYSWMSLGSEVGGVMGLLFGIGIVNVISLLLKSCVLGKGYFAKAMKEL
eukprot:PLAT12388.1.p1 GENE.PLAT12388.1~~PLAT12388.1.p1  ORF type:complete len:309 (+),score=93.19 PLAT12388.1:20-946(+)